MAEMETPDSEYKWPPYWNSTYVLDFDLRVALVIGISFYMFLPNFVVMYYWRRQNYDVI